MREKLNCAISFEENQYIISNLLLDITVWGSTRNDVEDAFAFAFHSLYENFALVEDKKLSAKAQDLKKTILGLVVNVIKNNEG